MRLRVFEAHREKEVMQNFFQKHCMGKGGFVGSYGVCTYKDEPRACHAIARGVEL